MTSQARARGLSIVLWTLLAFAIAGQVLRMRVAEAAVQRGDAATASAIRTQNGHGLALLAERQLRQGNATEARRTSLAALERTALTAGGARTLAMAYEKLGDVPASEGAWQAASRMGWRDAQTQLWAMLRALANRQPEIFALRADALLRTNNMQQATAVVRGLLATAQVRQAFVKRMKVDPPWLRSFFHWETPLQPADLTIMVATLRDLNTAGVVPPRGDLRDTINNLIASRRFAEAIELDRRFVRRIPDPGSAIDDSGFRFASDDYHRRVTPFDWHFTADSGALDESGGERSLPVTAAGTLAALTMQRYVALRPGNYVVRYDVWGDREAPGTLGFKIVCNSADRELGASERRPLAGVQHEIRQLAIKVPSDCPIIRIMVGQFWLGTNLSLQLDNVTVQLTS